MKACFWSSLIVGNKFSLRHDTTIKILTTPLVFLQLCSRKLLLPLVCCQISKDLLYSLRYKVSGMFEHPRKMCNTIIEWVGKLAKDNNN